MAGAEIAKTSSAARSAKSSAVRSEQSSTNNRRQDVPPEDNASAGRVAELLKAEEEAEAVGPAFCAVLLCLSRCFFSFFGPRSRVGAFRDARYLLGSSWILRV